MNLIRPTIVSFILLTAATGIVYPLAITAVGKVAFPNQAEGSLIDKNGNATNDESAAVGSRLIGQTFDAPQYFWSRPSATGPMPYNASASSGSNLGPTNSALTDAIKGRIDTLKQADPTNTDPVPVDLVTASASGLDPEESVAAAQYQVSRIAAVRHADPGKLKDLIAAHTTSSVFTETTVNVLTLNLALDRDFPYTPPATAPATTSAPAGK